ncbi:MAG: O-antigen ligase family protein [Candidatus Omnitrophica bacterium]|nr:O-antigen ligase family protein [Candidatus Omnitrophota bacterium]
MKKIGLFKRIILYLLCFLIFFRFIFDGMTYPIFNYIFTLSVFILFIFLVLFNSENIDFGLSEFYFFLFFLFSIFSSFFSKIKGTGVRYNAYIGSYLVLLITLKNIFSEENKKIFVNTILISIFFITIYGIYQRFWGLEETRRFLIENQQLLLNQYPNIAKYISPTFFDRMISNRIFSTFVYPNIYAGFLISIMPFLFFLFLKYYKKIWGIFCLSLFFLCLFNLILTESIGGILIFIFVFHIIFIHIIFGEKKLRKILPYLLSLELILFLLGYKLKILPHIHSFVDRVQYWKISMKIFPSSPFLGIGQENFKYYFLKFKTPNAMEAKHAHSLFFETLIENGLIGLILLFAFFILTILNILKSNKNKILNIGIFYSLLAFLLHNLVDFDFSDPSMAVIFFIFASFVENKRRTFSVGLTKIFLWVIIIIVGFSSIKLIKFENSERYRKYSEIEKKLEIRFYYLDKAENWYNKNFEVFSDRADLYLSLWKLTRDKKYLDISILNYKKAIDLNPYLIKGYRKLAYIYEEIGNYEMAEKMYLKLLEIYPNKKLYNLDVARFYKKMGNDDKFEYYYQKSKQLFGINIEEGILIEEIEKWIKLQK